MAMAIDSAATRFSDLCRLCATKIGSIQGLNIFANDASYRQIFKKIEACLPLQISETDVLPKMVCEDCIYKVELLFEFRERALRTESVLIELFKQLHSHSMPLHHSQHSQQLKLDALDHMSNSVLTDGFHVNDMDLPQISHRESMIILSQHNVPLDQLSQHDINQELPNHNIDGSDSILVAGNIYGAIEYQHHHILNDDMNLPHSSMHVMKNIVDLQESYALNELNHMKNSCGTTGVQRLMMNEAHFMDDHLNHDLNVDANIDSIISSMFCTTCGKSFDDKLQLEAHYQEHYAKPAYIHEKELENGHRKELHGSTIPDHMEPEELHEDPIYQPRNDPLVEQLPEDELIEEPAQNPPMIEETSTDNNLKLEQYSDVDSDALDIPTEEKTEEVQEENQSQNVVKKKEVREVEKPVEKKKRELKICQVCGKEYKTNYKLTEHMRKHTGEQPYKCKSCDKAFRSKIGLAQHEATHTGQFEFSCKICGKGFQCKSYLMVHQRVHSDAKPYSCTTCNRSFKTKQSLLDHTNRHLGVKPYACDLCDRSFITNGLLKAHQKIHSGADNRKYKCNVCNKKFVSKSYLQTHTRIHTGEKPFKCEVCGKGFSARVDLRTHSTMHTGEKSYQCEICGKAFARWDALRCHRRSHTGERPYKCEFCGQTFTQFSPMAIHKRIHTGERPYKCEVCNDRFVSRSTMMAHYKKHLKNDVIKDKAKKTESEKKEETDGNVNEKSKS